MDLSLTDRALPEQLPEWGVLVLESHHSSKFVMEWRTHSFVKIVYVLSGRGTFFIGKKEHLFTAGDVIVVPPGTRNRIVDDPVCASSLYVCCLARRVLRFDVSLIMQLPCGVLTRGGAFAHRVESVVRRMVHTQQSTTRMRPIAMMTYALGRELEIGDRPSTDKILAELQASNGGLRDLVRLIVQSKPFLSN